MTFDPKESVDMQGQTGPYVQNAFVRIQSIFRKAGLDSIELPSQLDEEIHDLEKELLVQIESYPTVLRESLEKYDPSHIANYCYNLAKTYHRFYHDCRILSADVASTKMWRLYISKVVGDTLKKGMQLLGIEMPEYTT